MTMHKWNINTTIVVNTYRNVNKTLVQTEIQNTISANITPSNLLTLMLDVVYYSEHW